MCIAIYKPKNKIISKETLEQCFKANSDGAGFMYSTKEKELKVQKGFFTFDEFYQAYQPHEKSKAVIHFRIKTHGAVAPENCHPFSINQSLGFVHNGIISGFGSVNASDTNAFNMEILQPLVAKWGNLSIFQPAMKELIESRIGYSKLIFLDRHGNHDIFNEDKGVWDDGVWYSNTSYLKPKPYIPMTYSSTYKPTPNLNAVLPPNYGVKDAGMYLKEGDLVTLNRPFLNTFTNSYIKLGTILEVFEVNTDYTIECMTDDKLEYLSSVPMKSLNIYKVIDDEIDNVIPLSFNNIKY